jgi:hypothetical protein
VYISRYQWWQLILISLWLITYWVDDYYGVTFDHLVPPDDTNPEVFTDEHY